MTTSAQNLTSRNERVINTQTLGALPSIEYGLIRAHVFASLVTLVISVLFGILVATKFTFPEFLGGHGWLTWGRLRYNHTQGIFFGWLGNAFLAFFYYVVPRLANRPVLSRRLGWFLCWIWNFAVVLPGWVLVGAGFSQPLEWAEFPLVVDAFVVVAFIWMVSEFVLPFLKAGLSDLYVSAWYIIGGIIFTMLAYPVGNLVPELVPGARGAAFSGLWIHDAVGLFVTPFAAAIAYYLIPATTRRAIFSHFLSLVGFWLLFFTYPLNGTHHYVYSAIPMAAQKGAIAHLWQRIPGTRYNERMMNWSFWLLAVGLTLMVTDLTIAGLVEAQFWQSSAPWIDSVRAVGSYWLVRTLSGLPILAGFVLFWISLVTGPKLPEATTSETSSEASESGVAFENVSPVSDKLNSTAWLSYAYVVAFGAGVGFFALSFLVLAILPGKELEAEIKQVAPVTMPMLTASEQRGRVIYGREGCAYCHTQQVRSLAADVRRFGAPTEPWETKYDYPQLWGTRRIGPDLSREFNLHSRDWQVTHLYNPRLVVRDSVMPPYPWLFDGSPSQPTQEGLEVLAYIQSLGRARQLSGFDHQTLASSVQPETPDMAMASEPSARATPPTVPIAMMGGYSLTAPVLHPASDRDDLQEEVSRGRTLFAANCASCHGSAGRGDGKASASLLPKPANLTAARFSDERLSSVLWNGVAGSAMPPWRQMPTEDLRALVAYIHSLHVPGAAPSTQDDKTLAEGASLFVANCASCHGGGGAGNGPAAGALAPPPTNFRLKKPTQGRAWDVLENGVPGTAMPPWRSQLSADQRRVLVEFVRSLYGPPQEKSRQ